MHKRILRLIKIITPARSTNPFIRKLIRTKQINNHECKFEMKEIFNILFLNRMRGLHFFLFAKNAGQVVFSDAIELILIESDDKKLMRNFDFLCHGNYRSIIFNKVWFNL